MKVSTFVSSLATTVSSVQPETNNAGHVSRDARKRYLSTFPHSFEFSPNNYSFPMSSPFSLEDDTVSYKADDEPEVPNEAAVEGFKTLVRLSLSEPKLFDALVNDLLEMVCDKLTVEVFNDIVVDLHNGDKDSLYEFLVVECLDNLQGKVYKCIQEEFREGMVGLLTLDIVTLLPVPDLLQYLLLLKNHKKAKMMDFIVSVKKSVNNRSDKELRNSFKRFFSSFNLKEELFGVEQKPVRRLMRKENDWRRLVYQNRTDFELKRIAEEMFSGQYNDEVTDKLAEAWISGFMKRNSKHAELGRPRK